MIIGFGVDNKAGEYSFLSLSEISQLLAKIFQSTRLDTGTVMILEGLR
jgi:hypothetical protein